MSKTVKYILLALAFVIFMVGAYFAYEKLSEGYKPGDLVEVPNAENISDSDEKDENSSNSTDPESNEVVKAPDFTVLDYDGNEVSLSDYFGKPIVVNFWATWCGPCQYEMPDFDALASEYGDDVVFMMVNMTDGTDDTVESVKEFVEDAGYGFPVYFDTEFDATVTYGVYSIPRSLFIKPSGEINFAYKGVMDEEFIRENIEAILE